MKSKKPNKVLGIVLTTTLLLQLSFHAIHVFTSHGTDSHSEQNEGTEQISEAYYTCSLCAKLLGSTGYFLSCVLSFFILAYPLEAIDYKWQICIAKPQWEQSLRGPPTHLRYLQ